MEKIYIVTIYFRFEFFENIIENLKIKFLLLKECKE